MRAKDVAPAAAFVDTSFFYASVDPRDPDYARARALLEVLEAGGTSCITSWDVVSETATLLLYRAGQRHALRFLDATLPRVRLVLVDDGLRSMAMNEFRRFNRFRTPRISMCDAVTFCILATTMKDVPCLSFDKGLRAIGLHVLP